MYKLAVFDLDSTLAELGKGIRTTDIESLRKLEQKGICFAVCSGKSVDYLCGFMRQVGLKRPMLIGENGAVVQIGVDLPPKDFYVLPYSDDARESIRILREKITKRLPNIWFQADMVGITPFPTSEEEFEIVAECIQDCGDMLKDVDVYQHVDSFDIVPKGTNKSRGIAFLCKLLGIKQEETIAVGDGVNDYPMFDYAALSLGVRVGDEQIVDHNFGSITDVLSYLLDL